MTHLKVAVRVRPMSQREHDLKATSIVHVETDKALSITNLKVRDVQHSGDSRDRIRRFTFDRCFAQNATQQDLFDAVSKEISSAIQNRYNSCVLAYGQSASGKTHTMIGFDEDTGIIPRLCQRIFDYLRKYDVQNKEKDIEVVERSTTEDWVREDNFIGKNDVKKSALATVSYLEIYNEKVRDLLSMHDGDSKTALKVREHPKKGPYVPGLSEKPASSPSTLLYWLHLGNANRQVAANGSNRHSSRSHSVFTITCCQGQSKVHLVDLAGSERPGTKNCSSTVFREGANINRSLVALGNVISILAESSTKYLRKRFVPFRDSILTWLLKDTLSGNSKTIMIATVSPASTCYNETVNTLRFGQRAKQIAVQPVYNEDPKERIIRNLRFEIEALKLLLLRANKINCDSPLHLPILNQFISCSSRSISDIGSSTESIISITSPRFATSADTLNSSAVTLDSPIVLSVKSELSEEDANNNNVNTLRNVIVASAKLLPVMNITTSINKSNAKSKLRRTFSVVDSKEKVVTKDPFASQEVLVDTTSASSSRKHSLDKLKKSVGLIKSPPSVKTPPFESKSVGTEVRNTPQKFDIKSRVDSIRKSPADRKPRSQIIASVTQRLYNKVKKKEIGTGTEDLLADAKSPEELNICSNARLRLRELTQKALRAHKWKTIDTQTDLFPVLRVKEISTDVDDLPIDLLEVKHAEISTDFIETSEAGVDCCMLQQFCETDQKISNSGFIVTRSCGTQSTGPFDVQPKIATPPTAISFKKYLQEPQVKILTPPSPKQMIYTNSVNLNVSQHFPIRQYSDASSQSSSTAQKTSDTQSQDSLDDDFQCLNPTPDLISNHNSLEQQSQVIKIETIAPVKFATTTSLQQELFMNQNDDFTLDNICTANCSVSPKYHERLESITRPSCYSSETCLYQEEERCQSFHEYYSKQMPFFVEESRTKFEECMRSSEPLVLKSIMKNYDDSSDEYCNSVYLEDRDDKFKDLPNSLEYHQVNMKKVRFMCENEHNCTNNNSKMVEAMTGFLKQATALMNTLSLVASNKTADQNTNKESSPQNQSSEQTPRAAKKRRSRSHSERHHHCCKRIYNETIATQTTPKHSEKEENYSLPLNQYNLVVQYSCDRLERCIDRLETKSHQPTPEELLHRFPQPFSAMPTPYLPSQGSPISIPGEDTSLDSTYTFSDYGSLPRRSSRRSLRVSCSPSGYLRQLTSMRKKIVDGSREQMEKAGCSSGSIHI